MNDLVVSTFSRAATLMVARFITELEQSDAELCAAVYESRRQGEKMHVGMTVGGGECRIELEMINDYGVRRLVASITEKAMPDPLPPAGEVIGH